MNIIFLSLTAMFSMNLVAQEQMIDTQRSSLTIHVGKAGLFSVAGHEHWVHAGFAEGSLNAKEPARVAFKVDARTLKVAPDDKLSAEKQSEVQNTMHSEVLESQKFPDIIFKSTAIQSIQAGRWLVTGDLNLHGQTRPVRVEVRAADGGYTGSAKLKQTDFGIRPVNVGGVVKVKNELEITFSVFPAPTQASH